MSNRIEEGSCIEGRYLVGRRIGSGGFGKVYVAYDKKKNEEPVAIKVERVNNRVLHGLQLEYEVLRNMFGGSPFGGFAQVYGYGEESRGFETYLVMDLLGPPLDKLFSICSYQFSLKTVLMLADQLILRLQQLHSLGIVHRDVKPENLMFGTGEEKDTLFLIDFGLAAPYRDNKATNVHIKNGRASLLVGTTTYMSVNAHLKRKLSRRDDMESLAYVLLFLLSGGRLPWSGLEAANDTQRKEKIMEMKLYVPAKELFQGNPLEFALYLKWVRQLDFEEMPKYTQYRMMFWNLAFALGFQYDGEYDWKVLKLVEEEEGYEEDKETKSNCYLT